MANSILNNIAASATNNQLVLTGAGLQKTLFRLSSGLRIQTGADDAAGLSIADGLKGQIRAMDQATRNANDAVSFIQIVDGALGQVTNMLHRAVSLAMQAANGLVEDTQRVSIDVEYQQLLDEINRIGADLNYNGRNIFGQEIGVYVGDTYTASSITFDTEFNGSTLSDANLDLDGTALNTSSNAMSALSLIKDAIMDVANKRAELGGYSNRLQVTVNVLATQSQNLLSAESQIRDANVAEEVATMTKYQILNQTGIAALAQANQSSQALTRLFQ